MMKWRDLFLVVVGVLAGAAVVLAVWWFNPPAPVFLPDDQLPVGGRGPVGLRFGSAMRRSMVETRLRLEPGGVGRIVWEDDRTVWVYPRVGMTSAQEYRLALDAGARSMAGQTVTQRTWLFDVRPAWVAYLSPANGSAEVWRADLRGELSLPLTSTGGRVLDFSVAPDGASLAFSVENDAGGSDIWLVRRDGEDQRRLVLCGLDRCSSPAWSPAGDQIAYALLRDNPWPGEIGGFPRPMSVSTVDGEVSPLTNDPVVSGSEFAWSPDGARLAFYDRYASAIRVRDLDSGVELLLQSNVGLGEWSPDGQRMIFTNEETVNGITSVRVYVADFSTGATTLVFGEGLSGTDTSLPRWSPDGEWLAFGQAVLAGSASKQIWLMRPDGQQAHALIEESNYTHAAYQWAPDGSALVYQRFAFGSSQNRPEVVVWEQASGASHVISVDAAAPRWMP